MDFNTKRNQLSSNKQEDTDEYRLYSIRLYEISTVLQCDIEIFVIFVRRFLDKVAKLVELLIELPPGIDVENSFTGHKKYFVGHSDLHSEYSRLLRDETSWYEQDLLLWRDKIFIHGKTLTTGSIISAATGIRLTKSIGVFEMREKDKNDFLKIKEKYEHRYPGMKVTENPFMMIDEFRKEIRERNINLDKEDLVRLGEILSRTGTSLDIRQIAKRVKVFIEKAAFIINS
jgi:hypothetical protein